MADVADVATAARRAAKAVVRTASAGALRAVGTDATRSLGTGACVVVAPHPDDETFGCGATIARLRASGVDVRVVFVSGGGASPAPPGTAVADIVAMRRAEAARALASLGVDADRVSHLDFEDGRLGAQEADIADALGRVFGTGEVARVFVTSARDRHPDHRAVARATRAATARVPRAPELLEYPIWQRAAGISAARDVLGGGAGRAARRPRLVRAEGFLDAKRRAVAAYASQLPHLPVGFVEDFLVGYETFTASDRCAAPPG